MRHKDLFKAYELSLTETGFSVEKGFDVAAFFSECFGIVRDEYTAV